MGAVSQPLQLSILVLYYTIYTTYEPENGNLFITLRIKKENTLCRRDFSYVKLRVYSFYYNFIGVNITSSLCIAGLGRHARRIPDYPDAIYILT